MFWWLIPVIVIGACFCYCFALAFLGAYIKLHPDKKLSIWCVKHIFKVKENSDNEI